jgi:hypothetical protein
MNKQMTKYFLITPLLSIVFFSYSVGEILNAQVSLTADDSSITAGQSTTLRWTTNDVTSCAATQAWSGNKNPAGGSEVISPTTTSDYGIRCTNSEGDLFSATRRVEVNLTSPPIEVGSPPTIVTVRFDNPFRASGNLFELLTNVIDNIILPIGGMLAVLAFIWSGFMYVTAQGNEAKLKTANRALLYTVIGTALLLGSWVIAIMIEATINQLR